MRREEEGDDGKGDSDDVVERRSYHWTPVMLAIFAAIASGKQQLGQPIQCWLPAEFRGQWERYAESYCFVEDTYFVPFNQTNFPQDDHHNLELHYYQWVPFFFVTQALLFLLPQLARNVSSKFSNLGFELTNLAIVLAQFVALDKFLGPE
jgi:hypothetical protein